jgi:hypothetical protein
MNIPVRIHVTVSFAEKAADSFDGTRIKAF